LLLGPCLTGCNHKEPASDTKQIVVPPQQSVDDHATTASVSDPRLHQTFADATVDMPPDDSLPPPATTVTGKSIGKLYTEVVRLWDTIRFIAPDGKPLDYRALLETEMGNIEITLRPDLAPNHVRSFIALAQAGYYDGLVFERTVHEEGQDANLELIEAGCPLGTGEIGYGGIGYWLKPEFSKAPHEEGTVGAMHGDEGDMGTCKFYITLSPAPFMNEHYTVFGKVTQGADIAHKILSLPVRNDAPEGDRPLKPIAIKKVTIQSKELEN
jgi:peptidylprolyl isomerase